MAVYSALILNPRKRGETKKKAPKRRKNPVVRQTKKKAKEMSPAARMALTATAARKRGDLTAKQEEALKKKKLSAWGLCKKAAEAPPKKRKVAKKAKKKVTKKKPKKVAKKRATRVPVGSKRVTTPTAAKRKKAAKKSKACPTVNPRKKKAAKKKVRRAKKAGNSGAVKCRARPTASSMAACRRGYQSWQESDKRQATKKKSATATCGPGVPTKKAAGYLGGKQRPKEYRGKNQATRKVTLEEQKKIMRQYMSLR